MKNAVSPLKQERESSHQSNIRALNGKVAKWNAGEPKAAFEEPKVFLKKGLFQNIGDEDAPKAVSESRVQN